MLDLRSDTVTKPGKGMLKAMLNANVGDDVFGEDPSVNELQNVMAAMFGKQAGLFCPSGTMANQIAINVHTQPGDEVICHELSHVYQYEGGGIARNSLASVKLVRNDQAILSPPEVTELINDDQDWLARTSLVVAEDTSNRGGGKCYSLKEIQALYKCCQSRGLKLHLDGARAFNAIVYKGHTYLSYGACFDSLSICLSKGLGAPAGTMLLGTAAFTKEARRVRKVMGGGMRQAGYLAAAASYALKYNIERLSDDHVHATALASVLSELPLVTRVIEPETNILLFEVPEVPGVSSIVARLEDRGLRGVPFGANRIRLVTHLDISDADVRKAEKILREVLE